MKPEPGVDRSNSTAEASRIREWVDRAQRGDENAFEHLVDHFKDRAYGLALRILRSPADAEEAAQDAFVRAWAALPRFRGESSFSTWLYRIVARRSFDRAALLRSRRGREAPAEAAPEPADPAGPADSAGLARRMEHLVHELPEMQRAVVTMFYYEDGSVEQVAQALGLPEGTVKTHLSRARAALRAAWLRDERTGVADAAR